MLCGMQPLPFHRRQRTAPVLQALPLFIFLVLLASCSSEAPSKDTPPQSSSMTTENESAERTGGWRLEKAPSPYLRQHADNAVDWHTWGEEAFALAKEKDLMVFLSVGYSSCHWCHVMEHESFEDEAIGELLRKHFISIKVDREAHPDVDAHYMKAVQAMTGRGGWPMSVFLTPEGEPFYGGTYYPPSGKYLGQAGFADILTHLARLWKDERPKMLESASKLEQALVADPVPQGLTWNPDTLLTDAVTQLIGQLDEHSGGTRGNMKFPPGQTLQLIMRQQLRAGWDDPTLIDFHLDAMATGGLWDHIGGGFHRYCVDTEWTIPHFEKMLYDNAILLATYAEGFAMTGNPRHAEVARGIYTWAKAEMWDEGTGLYYSALDADSLPFDATGTPIPDEHPEEGLFYAWNPAQVKEVLGDKDGDLFCRLFSVTETGNFEHGLSHPQPRKTAEALAASAVGDFPDTDAFAAWVDKSVATLALAREARPRPFRDEKCLAFWNGMLLSGMARASGLLDDDTLREATSNLAFGLMRHLLVGGPRAERPTVAHQYFEGEQNGSGNLSDHAAVGLGLLDAYEATGEVAFLLTSLRISTIIQEDFTDTEKGGFFDTTGDDPLLPNRGQDFQDGAVPSGTALALQLLARLSPLDDSEKTAGTVQAAIDRLAPLAGRAPQAFPSLLIATDAWLGPMLALGLAGTPGGGARGPMLSSARPHLVPARPLIPSANEAAGDLPAILGSEPALLEGRRATDTPIAWVCTRGLCQLPTSDPEQLAQQLADQGKR